MKHHPERQLQTLGIFVHGVLAGLHVLGIAYNAKRKNWFDVGMHGVAATYDVYAVAKHMRDLERCTKEVE